MFCLALDLICLALDLTSIERVQIYEPDARSQVPLAENTNAMPNNYEDNFGYYSVVDDQDELAFFYYVKPTSVLKICVRCNQKVYLQPKRKTCATCSEAIAYGAPPSLEEY
jgi:hypothetical protein